MVTALQGVAILSSVHAMSTAGESTRAMARQRRATIRLLLYGALGLGLSSIVVILWLMTYSWKMASAFGVAGCLILMAAMIGVFLLIKHTQDYASGAIETLKKREKDALKGADGEVAVARMLEEIASGRHMLFHDVNTPGGNIDHVLLSERGRIYLIETKTHHGAVTVENGVLRIDGQLPEKQFIQQVLANLARLKPKLDRITGEDTWVDLLLVFTNASVARDCRERNIAIINLGFLDTTLAQLDDRRPKVSLWPHREKIADLLRGIPQN